jgi:hypothetical protein
MLENHSAGDFSEEFEEKNDMIDLAASPDLGLFDTNKYFEKLYPPIKIQKPGFDLYASTNIFLFILVIYTFMFFGQFTVDQSNYLENSDNTSQIFEGSMVIMLLSFIMLIILERVLNRTDTKKVTKKSIINESKQFTKKDDLFKKSQTERSMTLKIKTMKTADLDRGEGSAASEFLDSIGG